MKRVFDSLMTIATLCFFLALFGALAGVFVGSLAGAATIIFEAMR